MSDLTVVARKLYSILQNQYDATDADLDIIENAIIDIVEREYTLQ
jgi:hypothetical protein